MALFPAIVTGVDLFLLLTYLGISFYLSYLFKIWQEPSIGSWGAGAFVASIAILFHLISVITYNQGLVIYQVFYRLATILTFISAWWFGIAHPMARRKTMDVLLVAFLSIPLGFVIPQVLFEIRLEVNNGLIFEQFTPGFNTFDFLNFLFYGLLYLIFARDSHLIYTASIKKQADTYRKSIALGHLIAWQFFAVGTGFLRYLAKFIGSPVYFGLPFLFLLVPLLTLGSRPFDWAREGHEPLLLLLIDQYGTPTYSWTKNYSEQSPLFLEGSTVATISSMFEQLVQEPLKSITVEFDQLTFYSRHDNNYLSILITTGPHQSFNHLLAQIHTILVTDVIKQSEVGLPGYTFPLELQWLLSQLLPNYDFNLVNDDQQSFKQLLMRSGIKLT